MSPDLQMSAVDKVVYWKKSLVPGCNTLAYRKDHNNLVNFFEENQNWLSEIQNLGVVFFRISWTFAFLKSSKELAPYNELFQCLSIFAIVFKHT